MHAKAVIEKNQSLREAEATLGQQLQEKQTVEIVKPAHSKQVAFEEKNKETVVERQSYSSEVKSREKKQEVEREKMEKENDQTY